MSLKTRFILIYGIGSIFFLSLITLFVFERMKNVMTQNMQTQFSLNAEKEIFGLNNSISALVDKYKSIPSMPIFRLIRFHQLTLNESSVKNEVRQLELFFLNLYKEHKEISLIQFLDNAGKEIIHIENSAITTHLTNLGHDPTIQSALQTEFNTTVTTTSMKAGLPDEITFWMPVDISSNIRLGVIGIYMDFEYLHSLIAALEKNSVWACVLDKERNLIIAGTYSSNCSQESSELWSYEHVLKLPGKQWTMQLLASPEIYLDEIGRLKLIIFGVALPFFAFIAFIVIYITTLTITNVIKTLVKGTRILGTDKKYSPIDIQRSDELGTLAHEINRTARYIDTKTKALIESNEELESYSYSIAHDLRSPLTAIAGFSQVLKSQAHDRLDAGQQIKLDRIIAASHKMSNLIDDILQLSRVTLQDINEKPVNLSQLATEICQNLQLNDADRQVNWHIDESSPLKGDPLLLRVLLEKLIDNAWKYTKHQPVAEIEFKTSYDNGRLTYHVKDNGVGFDMQYVEKLFKPFSRLHSASEFEGTGIGLATAKRIINKHNGTIWVNSKKGRGTTVSFSFAKHLDSLAKYL